MTITITSPEAVGMSTSRLERIETVMQAFVDDMRTQIDSLRNTIESLRAEAQKLDQRHKAAREKIGGRIDAIQAKIDEFRRGG